MIVTFNYDVLLERALEAVNKPFRLFGYRYAELDGWGGGILEDDNEEVIVLKLHGSIDWFDKSHYLARIEARKAGGSTTPTPDIIFNGGEDYGVRPILDGPRYDYDPFINMYRVARIEEVYRRGLMFHETPWLLSPSTNKIIYAGPLTSDHWRGIGVAGECSRGMAIISYSLPEHDLYARQAIYAMAKNYQNVNWDEEIIGQKKSPLMMVDFKQTAEEQADIRNRYRFVDYAKAELRMDGFNMAAIDKIFN